MARKKTAPAAPAPAATPDPSPTREQVIAAIAAKRWPAFAALAAEYDVSPTDLLGSVLRPMIRAAPGCKLVNADFAAIEARIVAWLGEEEWALAAYREGRDIYCEFGGQYLFGRPITKADEDERGISKEGILGGGFGLGPRTFAVRMNFRGASLAGKHHIEVIEAYRDSMPTLAGKPTGGLWIDVPSEQFGLAPHDAEALALLVSECQAKRASIGQIVDEAQRRLGITLHPRKARRGGYWKELHEAGLAVGAALRDTIWPAGRCTFHRKGPDVLVELPSGRMLVYPDARIEPADGLAPDDWRAGQEQFTWTDANGKQRTYGGRWCENVTQAIAYDLMAEVAADAEEAGWPLILTVHDEVLLEVPADRAEECREWLLDRMARGPAWADGLPLGSEAKVMDYYQK